LFLENLEVSYQKLIFKVVFHFGQVSMSANNQTGFPPGQQMVQKMGENQIVKCNLTHPSSVQFCQIPSDNKVNGR
jgi:hypothetical protein